MGWDLRDETQMYSRVDGFPVPLKDEGVDRPAEEEKEKDRERMK